MQTKEFIEKWKGCLTYAAENYLPEFEHDLNEVIKRESIKFLKFTDEAEERNYHNTDYNNWYNEFLTQTPQEDES